MRRLTISETTSVIVALAFLTIVFSTILGVWS